MGLCVALQLAALIRHAGNHPSPNILNEPWPKKLGPHQLGKRIQSWVVMAKDDVKKKQCHRLCWPAGASPERGVGFVEHYILHHQCSEALLTSPKNGICKLVPSQHRAGCGGGPRVSLVTTSTQAEGIWEYED